MCKCYPENQFIDGASPFRLSLLNGNLQVNVSSANALTNVPGRRQFETDHWGGRCYMLDFLVHCSQVDTLDLLATSEIQQFYCGSRLNIPLGCFEDCALHLLFYLYACH